VARPSPARHNFVYLFVALVLFMTVLPVAIDFGRFADSLVTELSLSLVLLIGVWSLEGSRWIFRSAWR